MNYAPPSLEVLEVKFEGVVCASTQSDGWFTNAQENNLSNLFEDEE